MAGVSHHTVGSDNLEASKTFYDALLGSIGAKPRMNGYKLCNYRLA